MEPGKFISGHPEVLSLAIVTMRRGRKRNAQPSNVEVIAPVRATARRGRPRNQPPPTQRTPQGRKPKFLR